MAKFYISVCKGDIYNKSNTNAYLAGLSNLNGFKANTINDCLAKVCETLTTAGFYADYDTGDKLTPSDLIDTTKGQVACSIVFNIKSANGNKLIKAVTIGEFTED